MIKRFHFVLIILYVLAFIALLLAGFISGALAVNKRISTVENELLISKQYLFLQILNQEENDKKPFVLFESTLKKTIQGFQGIQILEANGNVIYNSSTVAMIKTDSWKQSKHSNQAIIKKSGTQMVVSFIKPDTGEQFNIIIKLVDTIIIKNVLYIILAGIICIIFIFIQIIFFTSLKQNRVMVLKNEVDLEPQQNKAGNPFILSLNCLQMFKNYIAEAKDQTQPFSLAVLRIKNDIFDEDKQKEAFELLNAHIKSNKGYYEYNGQPMILLIPATPLKKAITLLRLFTDKIIEGNLNVDLQCGITSMNARDVSCEIMIQEAEMALDKAIEDPQNRVVGFNPDPDKYKEFKINQSKLDS